MKRSFLVRVVKSKLIFPLLAGGISLQLSGCDPEVRDSILTGVQTSVTGLVTTMINAVFTSFQNADDTTDTSGTTGTTGTSTQTSVQADPLDPSWFA